MDEKITSINNSLVKYSQKLQQKKYRDEEDKFLLEGYKSIEEAVNAKLDIEYIFVLEDKINKYSFYKGRKYITTEAVLGKISVADTPPEAVGIARKKHFNLGDFKNYKRVILLEDIKDLGNLGTIIRTACAFGANGIILYGNCADMYNPKCVRASVGNLWKIPIAKTSSISELNAIFNDFDRIATLPLAKKHLKEYKIGEKALIMFGSEANGLSDELINFSTDSIKIEMSENVESLNLAVSCSVIMYNCFNNGK